MPATSCPTGSAKLVEGEILERCPDPADRRKVVYSLTAKGEALLPVVLALRQWGEDWGHGCQEIFLADKQDGQPVRRICVQAHDGRELKLGDMMWVDRADRRDASSTRTRAERKGRPRRTALLNLRTRSSDYS